MTLAAVARKDFQDARLSKALWTLTALFVLMSAGMAYLYATVPELSGGVSTIGLLFMLGAPATLFIAIAAIIVAVGSIAGERSSGSAKILLGLPHTRRDIVLGKLVGRTAVLSVAILTGLAVTLVVPDLLPLGAAFVLNGFSAQGMTTMSPLVEFPGVVTPTAAYQHAIGWFLGTLSAAAPTPFYLTGWMSLLLLAGWLVVPLAIGYRRFRGSDL